MSDLLRRICGSFPKTRGRLWGINSSRVQQGKEPDDWKPIPTVGPGVNEIRVWENSGTYRVIYVAKFEEAVYVLHVFEKRSQKTPKGDIHLARGRYADLLKWRKEQ
ncbi:MAG: type II toxin-antitoxin system RelE/ParE family toxin [Nitrospiraceae bacterium]|nr:type II toxin-antitoxin system RelE/ParE family toxin [Nitrospiraceae bacterium]